MKSQIRFLSLLVALLTVCAILLSCAAKNPLVGTWSYSEKYEGEESEFSYEIHFTFRDDGTGELVAGDISRKLTYTAADGELKIKYTSGEENGVSVNFTYAVEDGKLTLTNDAGSTVFQKVS